MTTAQLAQYLIWLSLALQSIVVFVSIPYSAPWFRAYLIASILRTATHSAPFASSLLLDTPILVMLAGAALEAFFLYTKFTGDAERKQGILQGAILAGMACGCIASLASPQANLANQALATLQRTTDAAVMVFCGMTLMYGALRPWERGHFSRHHMPLLFSWSLALTVARLWPIHGNHAEVNACLFTALCLIHMGWLWLFLGRVSLRDLWPRRSSI